MKAFNQWANTDFTSIPLETVDTLYPVTEIVPNLRAIIVCLMRQVKVAAHGRPTVGV